MTKARIYSPAKTAMQSGKAKTGGWLLEMISDAKPQTEPLMGWTTMPDTIREVRLKFSTKEEAIAYANKHRILYELYEPKPRPIIKKAYADNFKFDKDPLVKRHP